MFSASLYLSLEDELLCFAGLFALLCVIGAGGRTARWWIRAERPTVEWLRSPTRMILRALAPVFVVSLVFYPVGWDWSALARNIERAYFWRTLGYAALMEIPAVCLVTWACVHMVTRYVNRGRGPGCVEVHGWVVEGARVIGEPGETKLRVAFEVRSDAGERWDVESQPGCVWPIASLAQGFSVRRIAPTHPSSAPWLGLRTGDRVWLVGASPVAGEPSRLVVAAERGLIVRGGPAAAYTGWLPMAVILWVLVRYIQPVGWLYAVAFDLGQL
jgi:hypothetical protein